MNYQGEKDLLIKDIRPTISNIDKWMKQLASIYRSRKAVIELRLYTIPQLRTSTPLTNAEEVALEKELNWLKGQFNLVDKITSMLPEIERDAVQFYLKTKVKNDFFKSAIKRMVRIIREMNHGCYTVKDQYVLVVED